MGLFGGAVLVTLGTLGRLQLVAWSGVALAAGSLAVNSAGKIVRYSRVELSPSQRASVIGAWLLLVAGLFGLIADYTYSQFNQRYEGYFWALAFGVVGLAMVYQGTRSKFVDDGVAETTKG